MKLLYLPSLFILLLFSAPAQADPIDNVAGLIRQGNTQQLVQLFSSNVDLAVMDDENSYSNTQAGIILDKFFAANKPRSVKVLHKVNSNPNYLFAVLFLTTDKGVYRVAYTLNKRDGAMKIIELRIESEKTK